MGNKSRRGPEISALERQRVELAKERDHAIERFNELVKAHNELLHVHQRMQNHMSRWCIAFMLKTGQHKVVLDESLLLKTNQWVLHRQNDTEARTATWTLEEREKFDERQKTEQQPDAQGE